MKPGQRQDESGQEGGRAQRQAPAKLAGEHCEQRGRSAQQKLERAGPPLRVDGTATVHVGGRPDGNQAAADDGIGDPAGSAAGPQQRDPEAGQQQRIYHGIQV